MRVQLTARSRKDLARLPAKARLRILRAMRVLAGKSLQDVTGLRRLEGVHGLEVYRMRVGPYRILLKAEFDVVTILRVISRQELQEAVRRIARR